MKWKSLSRVQLFVTPWTVQSMEFFRPTEVGSCFLLQRIFPTQGLNSGLLHCRQILYQLSHQGSPNTRNIKQIIGFVLERAEESGDLCLLNTASLHMWNYVLILQTHHSKPINNKILIEQIWYARLLFCTSCDLIIFPYQSNKTHFRILIFCWFLIISFYFTLLYNTVLVLPHISMNLPWVYMCSQSRAPLPPPWFCRSDSPEVRPKHQSLFKLPKASRNSNLIDLVCTMGFGLLKYSQVQQVE